MSATPFALHASMDYSTPSWRIIPLTWTVDENDVAYLSTLNLRVHFVCRWPSMRDRGFGVNGEVLILGIEYERDDTGRHWARFDAPPPIEAALLSKLEAEELTQ